MGFENYNFPGLGENTKKGCNNKWCIYEYNNINWKYQNLKTRNMTFDICIRKPWNIPNKPLFKKKTVRVWFLQS